MTTEFLCRAKRTDNNKWVAGTYMRHVNRMPAPVGDDLKPEDIEDIMLFDGFADWNMPRSIQYVKIDPNTVNRCTGLKDSHGTMIFEGDFIRSGSYVFVVKYGRCGGTQNVDHEVGYIGFYVEPVGFAAQELMLYGIRNDILYWINGNETAIIGNVIDDGAVIDTM